MLFYLLCFSVTLQQMNETLEIKNDHNNYTLGSCMGNYVYFNWFYIASQVMGAGLPLILCQGSHGPRASYTPMHND